MDTDELLTALEDLLVREFRTCQELLNLVRIQQRSDPARPPETLRGIETRRSALVERLERLETERRALLAAAGPLETPGGSQSPDAGGERLDRLSRLRAGVLVLRGELRSAGELQDIETGYHQGAQSGDTAPDFERPYDLHKED